MLSMANRYFIHVVITAVVALALLTGRSAAAAPIPDYAKDIVTFLFIKDDSGGLVANGTGFFVGVQNPENPKRVHGYLVTAKHVLMNADRQFLPEVFVRLNKKEGGSQEIRLPLSGKDALPIYTHQDDTVDLAVLPLMPKHDLYAVKVLAANLIATRDRYTKAQIREGQEIFFTGLFTPLANADRNYPIVRFGRVALVTDEPVPMNGQLVDLLLVEMQSYGGSSGSPVFISHDSDLLLAGVLKGSFFNAKELRTGLGLEMRIPFSMQNLGISGVVPAYYLMEILFSEGLKKARGTAQ